MVNPLKMISTVTKATAKPKEEVISPLAQLVASRMIGQLQAVPEVVGMPGLSKLNLPAAYAGDMRSMQAAQRAINEAETGIASPSRRKFVKQAAATTARQAVPGVVDTVLGMAARGAIKEVVTPATEIPVESLQAAAMQAMRDALQNKAIKKYAPKYPMSDVLWWANKPSNRSEFTSYTDLLKLQDSKLSGLAGTAFGGGLDDVVPLRSLIEAYAALEPKALAAKYGLPEDAVKAHFRKSSLPEIINEWSNNGSIVDEFAEETAKNKFFDYGFDVFPTEHPKFLELAKQGLKGDDANEALWRLHEDQFVSSPYESHVFGDEGLKTLEEMPHGLTPTRHLQRQLYEQGLDDDDVLERVATLLDNIRLGKYK